jgi:hypothetical protein
MNYATPFKADLEKRLTDKGLSASSIRLYLRNLEKLNDDMPLKNLNFLKNVEYIVNKLIDYKENTKRGYLISITSALSTDKTTKAKQKLYDTYLKLMVDKNKQLKAQESTNTMTETQEKNWVSWTDVEKKMKELEEKVAKFKDAKEINESNYNTLLSYMILSLYYYKQPRRNMDYQKVIVIKNEMPDLPTTDNYLVYADKKFIFNVFKTAKKEGQQTEEIPDSLMAIINLYLKFHPYFRLHPISKMKKADNNNSDPQRYFLVYFNGKPLDKVNSITRILNKVFGKSVGSSLLRHSYLTAKNGKVLETLKEDAKAMGHSVDQALDYIKHTPPTLVISDP